MRSVDEIINTIVHQSALLFRNTSAKRRRQAITTRIEQVRGMSELAREFDYSELVMRLDQHIAALKQTLKRD